MINARMELIEHIADRCVEYVYISYNQSIDDNKIFQGSLEEVLPNLNFDYDNGFGTQYIEGMIWYDDGSWSERREYDGSEWWVHLVCPPVPIKRVGM